MSRGRGAEGGGAGATLNLRSRTCTSYRDIAHTRQGTLNPVAQTKTKIFAMAPIHFPGDIWVTAYAPSMLLQIKVHRVRQSGVPARPILNLAARCSIDIRYWCTWHYMHRRGCYRRHNWL